MGGGDTEVYRCSNGRYYTDVQLWRRLEREVWRVCCWNPETQEEWVVGPFDELLSLRPVEEDDLPGTVSLRQTDDGPVVAPRRPSGRGLGRPEP